MKKNNVAFNVCWMKMVLNQNRVYLKTKEIEIMFRASNTDGFSFEEYLITK